ncbi:MAG: hypothetical protein ACR2P9_08050 [Gammaproteobacteria bacterium]
MRIYPLQIMGLLLCGIIISPGYAGDDDNRAAFNGIWIWNEKLSDNADKQVARAIIAAGGKLKKNKNKGKYKYKGGPANHAMYNHITYDEVFHFHYAAPKVRIAYLDNYTREFYADGRGRSASATGGKVRDFSFADWDEDVLYVEARPRDGGKTYETYTLIDDGARLQVKMEIRPLSFGASVRITRIFDRKTDGEGAPDSEP